MLTREQKIKNLGKYAKKGAVPWNKGLTKDDPRVKKYYDKWIKIMESKPRVKYWKGKKRPEIAEKISKANKGNIVWNKGLKGYRAGEVNNKWKGDFVGYSALHHWINRTAGKAKECSFDTEHEVKRYHWANISGSYLRDISDYTSLCPKCHKQYDLIRGGGIIYG